jgi:hypothetical protein
VGLSQQQKIIIINLVAIKAIDNRKGIRPISQHYYMQGSYKLSKKFKDGQEITLYCLSTKCASAILNEHEGRGWKIARHVFGEFVPTNLNTRFLSFYVALLHKLFSIS